MDNYYDTLLSNMERDLKEVAIEVEGVIKWSEKSITIVIQSIEKVKAYVIANDFKNTEDEIYFFKEIKPKFTSRYIFYSAIYNVEINKPHGDCNSMIKYYKKEQCLIKTYFRKNLDFYKYYRSKSMLLDYKYFVRCERDFKLSLDNCYLEADYRFTTSHDYKVANIIANDLILKYLERKILILEGKEHLIKPSPIAQKPKLTWTQNKSNLVELIYALHTQAVFDNGKTEIKEIASYFENVFNIELGDYYRTFSEIRMRKGFRTKFMDSLREELNKRMDQQDEK